MLLFRRELLLAHDETDGPATTVVASFYRDHVDSGYQAMITAKAEAGVFDWSILRRMDEIFRNGKEKSFSFWGWPSKLQIYFQEPKTSTIHRAFKLTFQTHCLFLWTLK